MTRRQLESALLASALIENGLSTLFRFTKIQFQRNLSPPNYQSHADSDVIKVPEEPDCRRCNRFRESPPQSKPSCPEGDIPDRTDFGIHALKLSANGKTLVFGDANSSVINVLEGRQQQVLRPSKWKLGMPVTCLCYMPNDLNSVLGCTPHGEIFCLDLNHEGFETLIKEENQQTYCFDISPDGIQMATAGNNTSIRIYSIHSGQLSEFETQNDETHMYKSKSNKVRRCTFSSTAETKSFLVEGGQPEQMMHQSTRVCVPTARGRRQGPLLNSTKPNVSELVIPEILGYRPAGPADNYTEGHSMRITALKYHSAQPKLLASASWDHHVKVWDTRTRSEPVQEIYGPLICSPEGLDIDDNYLLTASWRKCHALEIWDLRNLCRTGNKGEVVNSGYVRTTLNKNAYMNPAEIIPIAPSTHHHPSAEYLYSAHFLPNRAVICGGSGFNEVQVMLVSIPVNSAVQTLDTVLEGRFVGVGCANGSITIAGLA
ncbi:hypothetical protein Aperf_G00000113815 [Anoplocephala perfoliata]